MSRKFDLMNCFIAFEFPQPRKMNFNVMPLLYLQHTTLKLERGVWSLVAVKNKELLLPELFSSRQSSSYWTRLIVFSFLYTHYYIRIQFVLLMSYFPCFSPLTPMSLYNCIAGNFSIGYSNRKKYPIVLSQSLREPHNNNCGAQTFYHHTRRSNSCSSRRRSGGTRNVSSAHNDTSNYFAFA